MPNGASRAAAVTASGRRAARSAASMPPSEAPTTGHGRAPVASSASHDDDEPAQVVVRDLEARPPVEPGDRRDDDVPAGVAEGVEGRRGGRVAGDAGQVDEVPLIARLDPGGRRRRPPSAAAALAGHHGSSMSPNRPRSPGATLSPKSFELWRVSSSLMLPNCSIVSRWPQLNVLATSSSVSRTVSGLPITT